VVLTHTPAWTGAKRCGLAGTVLPLFAAGASWRPMPERVEPPVPLLATKQGRELVDDCRNVGLSLDRNSVAFLRTTLAAQGMVECGDLRHIHDGRHVVVPGIVLVRQTPGSDDWWTYRHLSYASRPFSWPASRHHEGAPGRPPGGLAQHAGSNQLFEQDQRRLRTESQPVGEAAGGQHR